MFPFFTPHPFYSLSPLFCLLSIYSASTQNIQEVCLLSDFFQLSNCARFSIPTIFYIIQESSFILQILFCSLQPMKKGQCNVEITHWYRVYIFHRFIIMLPLSHHYVIFFLYSSFLSSSFLQPTFFISPCTFLTISEEEVMYQQGTNACTTALKDATKNCLAKFIENKKCSL